jgi:hypothetical protein
MDTIIQAQTSGLIELLVAVTPLVRDLLTGAAKAVDNQVSSNAPLTKSETETPKLTAADRRICMGLTKRDNKLAIALLVEKDESSAERKAEHLATEAGNYVTHLVTGLAHSSKVAVFGVDLRHVGVPGDNDIDTLSYRIDLQGVQVMQNVEQTSRELHELGFGKTGGPCARVHVPPDRRDRGNPLQRGNDPGIADVAAVNDVIDMSQHAKSLRPKQAVRIRDDADGEGHRSVRSKHPITRWATAVEEGNPRFPERRLSPGPANNAVVPGQKNAPQCGAFSIAS